MYNFLDACKNQTAINTAGFGISDLESSVVRTVLVECSRCLFGKFTLEGVVNMHAIVRNYSGTGANELFGMLEERQAEVESLIRSVTGFVAYSLIRTDDGGVTVTVCKDKAGTDESLQLARDWIQENAPDLGVSPPAVSEGAVVLHLK